MLLEKKVIRYKGKIIFEKIKLPRFQRLPKRYEEDEACFMFLDGGEFTIRSSSTIFKINDRSALLSKCMNYFFELQEEKSEGENDIVEAVGVMLYPDIISEVFDIKLLNIKPQQNDPIYKIDIDPLLQSFKDSISYLLDHPSIADETLIHLKLQEFVQLMMRQKQNHSIIDFFSSLFNPIIYNIEQTISNNLYTNLSVEELAFLCKMSLSTFKRRFKEIYHSSPHRYLLKKKIEHACYLLSLKEKNVSQVAFECGFESASTFNKNFKKIMNLSPTKYVEEL